MIDAAAHFSRSYGEARDRFLSAAAARRLQITSTPHPCRGPAGVELALDCVADGDPASPAMLVVSSGTHGVEGYTGAGVQCAWLADDAARNAVTSAGVRTVLLHALNPWGFAHDARSDENNVDLNRNFRDFGAAQPANPLYAALHPLLLPERWPPAPANEARLWLNVLRHGRRRFTDALARGQVERADGLFYAGREASWGNRTLRMVLRREAAGCRAAAWIDLHTGLGRHGRTEAIFNGRPDAGALSRARNWFGPEVTSMYDGSSSSSEVAGANFAALDDAGIAATAAITLEAGTRSPRAVLAALRARQWLRGHPDAAASLRDAILAQSRAAFHADDAHWQRGVYAGARAALLRGARSVGAEVPR